MISHPSNAARNAFVATGIETRLPTCGIKTPAALPTRATCQFQYARKINPSPCRNTSAKQECSNLNVSHGLVRPHMKPNWNSHSPRLLWSELICSLQFPISELTSVQIRVDSNKYPKWREKKKKRSKGAERFRELHARSVVTSSNCEFPEHTPSHKHSIHVGIRATKPTKLFCHAGHGGTKQPAEVNIVSGFRTFTVVDRKRCHKGHNFVRKIMRCTNEYE